LELQRPARPSKGGMPTKNGTWVKEDLQYLQFYQVCPEKSGRKGLSGTNVGAGFVEADLQEGDFAITSAGTLLGGLEVHWGEDTI